MVIEENEASIIDDFWGAPTVVVTPGAIYLSYDVGGPREIRVFSHDGERIAGPALAGVATAGPSSGCAATA